jgi:hypothetical protein
LILFFRIGVPSLVVFVVFFFDKLPDFLAGYGGYVLGIITNGGPTTLLLCYNTDTFGILFACFMIWIV